MRLLSLPCVTPRVNHVIVAFCRSPARVADDDRYTRMVREECANK